MMKDELQVPFDSFEENFAQIMTFSNTPFKKSGTHFLFHGTEKG